MVGGDERRRSFGTTEGRRTDGEGDLECVELLGGEDMMMEEGGGRGGGMCKRSREQEIWNGLHVCGDWEGEILIVGVAGWPNNVSG